MICSCGSLAAVWAVRYSLAASMLPRGDERPRQVLAQLAVVRIETRGLAQQLQRVAAPPGGVERRSEGLEVTGRDHELAGAFELAGNKYTFGADARGCPRRPA